MVAMHMVQVTIVNVIHMITVADHFMGVIGTMHVIGMGRGVHRRFTIWIGRADLNHMLIDMVAVDKVQMAIMQIVPMIDMPDPVMPAAFTMHVRVVLVNLRGMIFWGHCAGAQTRENQS